MWYWAKNAILVAALSRLDFRNRKKSHLAHNREAHISPICGGGFCYFIEAFWHARAEAGNSEGFLKGA